MDIAYKGKKRVSEKLRLEGAEACQCTWLLNVLQLIVCLRRGLNRAMLTVVMNMGF